MALRVLLCLLLPSFVYNKQTIHARLYLSSTANWKISWPMRLWESFSSLLWQLYYHASLRFGSFAVHYPPQLNAVWRRSFFVWFNQVMTLNVLHNIPCTNCIIYWISCFYPDCRICFASFSCFTSVILNYNFCVWVCSFIFINLTQYRSSALRSVHLYLILLPYKDSHCTARYYNNCSLSPV